MGETQVYCTSLKVHHGHFRGLLLLFISLLLIVIVSSKASPYKDRSPRFDVFWLVIGGERGKVGHVGWMTS